MILEVESQLEGICEVSCVDKSPCGYDADALLPVARPLGQLIDRCPISVEQVVTYDVPAGKIDEIPVVDASGVAQVELVDGLSFRFLDAFTLHPIDQDEQGTTACLMPWAVE